MSALSKIQQPIKEDIKKFEPFFRSSMKSKVPLLDIITNYVIRRKGKQLRPMLVFLSAKLHGEICESTYTAASMIELLHTATLIHDDVVDESYERRGFFSINALWKNKIAVLVGDFFLSKGLLLAVQSKEYRLLEIMSEAVREMSEGELLQIEKARKLKATEEIYYEIIKKKTASLISSCTASGTESVNADEDTVKSMYEFGEYVGMAFQIKDDLLDYGSSKEIGKPTGNDIQEKKFTLPLIHVLNNASSSDRKRIINIVRNDNKNKKKVKEVVDFVKSNGGLVYAEKIMNEYKQKALDLLKTFPLNEANESLEALVNYVTERTK